MSLTLHIRYTSAGKIILNGGSNGGLLVAACTNQAREGLIGASIADVGVHDMLKVSIWISMSSKRGEDEVRD